MQVSKQLCVFGKVLWYAMVLVVGVMFLFYGLCLTGDGHPVIGPAIAFSGFMGCRHTGLAIARYMKKNQEQ